MAKMIIKIMSWINADGFIIYITDEKEKTIFSKQYCYGQNVSYSREYAEIAKKDYQLFRNSENSWYYKLKPYVSDIIIELCNNFNITKENIKIIAGKSTFHNQKIKESDINDFKTEYLNF